MPVQLAHSTRLDLGQRRGDRFADREVARIGDPRRSASEWVL
jgi:hypothetical protein